MEGISISIESDIGSSEGMERLPSFDNGSTIGMVTDIEASSLANFDLAETSDALRPPILTK